MTKHHLNRIARDLAVEQSLDAAIEIVEVLKGKRSDSPALAELVSMLSGQVQNRSVTHDLLSNSQTASLYHRAFAFSGKKYETAADLSDAVSILITVESDNLSKYNSEELSFLRDFCLGLNKELVSEAYHRVPEPPLARKKHKDLAMANEY